MSDTSLLDITLMISTCIFFCLWAIAIMGRHTDHHYLAIRYAVFILREPDRAAFLITWINGTDKDIATRFPGFETYREQFEKSRS